MHASTRKRWQLFMMFGRRTDQMHFHWLVFRIDAIKLIKRHLQRVPPRLITSNGKMMPPCNQGSIWRKELPFTEIVAFMDSHRYRLFGFRIHRPPLNVPSGVHHGCHFPPLSNPRDHLHASPLSLSLSAYACVFSFSHNFFLQQRSRSHFHCLF